MSRGGASLYAQRVVRIRFALLLVALAPLLARAACEKTRIDLPRACVGDAVTAEARFCFAPEAGCLAGGVVASVRGPLPPFALVTLHVEGPLGRVPAPPAGLPIVLLPGETLVAEVSATPTEAGEARDRLVWVLASDDGGDRGGRGHEETCDVDLRVAAPTCGTAGGACTAGTCVAGACLTVRAEGPCDDGDPCTVGDRCKDGVCVPGPPRICGGAPCEAPGACVAGACVVGGPIIVLGREPVHGRRL